MTARDGCQLTYLDPATCPTPRPAREDMAAATRTLHDALDANAPWLHPERRTIQRDLGSSARGVAWQEAKKGFVDHGDLAAVAAAVTPATKLVFAEAITNPLGRVQDVPALAAAAKHAPLVLDTTIATPWGFHARALARGAAVVVASMTKAIGGQ